MSCHLADELREGEASPSACSRINSAYRANRSCRSIVTVSESTPRQTAIWTPSNLLALALLTGCCCLTSPDAWLHFIHPQSSSVNVSHLPINLPPPRSARYVHTNDRQTDRQASDITSYVTSTSTQLMTRHMSDSQAPKNSYVTIGMTTSKMCLKVYFKSWQNAVLKSSIKLRGISSSRQLGRRGRKLGSREHGGPGCGDVE